MGKGGALSGRKKEVNTGEGQWIKITVRMSEKATRNHTINNLHKNSTTCDSMCKYTYIILKNFYS